MYGRIFIFLSEPVIIYEGKTKKNDYIMVDLKSHFFRIFQHKIYKETFWSFATKGVGFFLLLGLNIFLARALGVEGFGEWSFFLSIITIILLISYFGINVSTRKHIAEYSQTDLLRSVFISSLKLRIIISLLFSLILLLLYKPLTDLLGIPGFGVLLLYGVPIIFFSGLVEYLKEIFQGIHRLKYNFIITTLEYGLKLILVVVFLFYFNSLISVVNAFSLALILTSIVGFYIIYTRYLCNECDIHQNFMGSIFKYCLPLLILSIGFLIATELDTVMLGLLSTESEVGIYAVAKQPAVRLPHISYAIAMGTMPIFAKLNESNKAELKGIFNKILKINLLIFSIITLGILLFAGFFVPLLFGSEYSASVLPMQILTIYTLSYSIAIIFNYFMDYQGMAAKRALNIVFSIFLNIVLNVFLIPIYGAIGAAIATSVSYLPYVFLNWLEVRRVFR